MIGGGHVGYNWQTSNWVFGVEVSGSGAEIEGGSTLLNTSGNPAKGLGDDLFDSKIRALFLAIVRLGYAWDRSLLYVKGGYAGAQVKTELREANPQDVNGKCACGGFDEKWRSGATVGAGLEYALTDSWILGLEYNYVRLGGHRDLIADGVSSALLADAPRDLHLLTGRLSYKFAGPISAK